MIALHTLTFVALAPTPPATQAEAPKPAASGVALMLPSVEGGEGAPAADAIAAVVTKK